jgi:DNA repair protein RecN (Recombination protein N)
LLEGSYQDANTSIGAMPNLHDTVRAITKVEDQIGQSATDLITRLDSSYTELSDILSELKDQLFQVETGDTSLDAIDERLHSYRVQARKHRSKADDLPELLNELSEKLSLLDGQDGKIAALEKAAENTKQDYHTEAKILSEKRQKAALKFDKAIMKELPALKLASAEFQTDIQDKEERLWNADGIDDISFTVKTNAGSSFAPLNKCASGGELSRIMLALKVVLSAVSPIPVMVFDEVDSGMGGATAAALGDRLAALSQNVQLLVITHAPQIAARAITHMVVSKRDIDKNQTETTVSILNGTDQRRDEIARMLSGENITDEARAAAQSLMDAVPSTTSPSKKNKAA